ncbi:unnamed protein product [Periconia digitata]|uniref:Ankyrin n=1 Tax=Periconia digitata TaxID=1303443 RepID=A0A9W4U2G8_9PLEO|nr:unnamed protein product [Periconia digitata]
MMTYSCLARRAYQATLFSFPAIALIKSSVVKGQTTMSLLDLADETLIDVIFLVVQVAGLTEAKTLRLICRRFDMLAQDCIFHFPRIILASHSISEPLRVRLILAKMRTKEPNKLCSAIQCTADYLASVTSSELQEQYVVSLAQLAARSMIYWHLVECLYTKPEARISSREVQENALVAAAETNQLQLVEELLSTTLNGACATRYFGELLATAASSGSLSLVLILLNHWDWDDPSHINSTRYIHAVQAAALRGRKDIVLILLDCGQSLIKSLYDDAIVQVAKAGQISVVELLLNRRQQHSDSDREKAFWITLIRTSVEWDNLSVLRHIVEKDTSMLGETAIREAIEDAFRDGHHKGLHILLSALQNMSTRTAEHYIGGLFWAAWSGRLENLISLMTIFQQEQRQIFRALAGAISGKRPSIVAYLLQCAGIDLNDDEIPLRFTDAVHLILPEKSSIRNNERTAPMAYLTQSLLEASRCGNLAGVIDAFQAVKAQYPDDIPMSFSGAFSAAAQNNHPDILLYLCENCTPHLISSCATSTSVVQIFKDFGWDVNQVDTDSTFPRLGFVHDVHFCRWLLDNGASLNTRGEMDITPISVAVRRAPMSTIKLFLKRCNGIRSGQLVHFAIDREGEDAVEVIELLLNLGWPVDSIMFQDDPRSWMQWKLGDPATPLLTAVRKGRIEIVKFLIGRGADPTRSSMRGKAPLQAAERLGYTSIANLLRQYY